MEIIAIAIFVAVIVGMVLFVRYKNKKAAQERAVRNAAGLAAMEAEWAVSELNPSSPNFDVVKYDAMIASLKQYGIVQ